MTALFVLRFALVAFLLIFSSLAYGRNVIFRYRHWLLPSLSIIIFSLLFYFTREQFISWHAGEFTKVFVPPFNSQGINYFLSFVFFRMWVEFIFSLVCACIFLLVATRLNRRFGERFFYEDELHFGAAGIFLVGYPGLVYYLFLFFGMYVVLQVVALIYFHESRRISPYFLWLSLALVLIVLQFWLGNKMPYLSVLVI